MSKIVKSQIESNSQQRFGTIRLHLWCVKDRQITNWKQFTTTERWIHLPSRVCQRSSNHKLKAIHNRVVNVLLVATGVSKIVKSQIESNSQHIVSHKGIHARCVKDRQITNWKQFTTLSHCRLPLRWGVSKIVKSQIESNSQLGLIMKKYAARCVKDRQITNWKQFTTAGGTIIKGTPVCQRSSNHKLKAIHNTLFKTLLPGSGVSKIVKSQIESNSQLVYKKGKFYLGVSKIVKSQIESNSQRPIQNPPQAWRCVKDRQITNWKQFTTDKSKIK